MSGVKGSTKRRASSSASLGGKDVIPAEWTKKRGDIGSAEPNSSRENLSLRPEPATEDGSSNDEEMAPTPRAEKVSSVNRKSVHTHECRKYRDKISTKFKELLQVVPESENYKLKHKADILDHAVNVIKNMSDQIRQLKRELVINNDVRTRDWAQLTAQLAQMGNVCGVGEEFCRVVEGEPGWSETRAWQIDDNYTELTLIGSNRSGVVPSNAARLAAKTLQQQKGDNVFACPLSIEGVTIIVVELIGDGDTTVPTKLASHLSEVFKALSPIEPSSEPDAKRPREDDDFKGKSSIPFLLND
mmetsp:Transcript_2888/g.8830  ORF Transcript_2888/g.8830 Transcript_2888/m.8830 type:complete len:301 (+) Transcript_2888:268-1170(+)